MTAFFGRRLVTRDRDIPPRSRCLPTTQRGRPEAATPVPTTGARFHPFPSSSRLTLRFTVAHPARRFLRAPKMASQHPLEQAPARPGHDGSNSSILSLFFPPLPRLLHLSIPIAFHIFLAWQTGLIFTLISPRSRCHSASSSVRSPFLRRVVVLSLLPPSSESVAAGAHRPTPRKC